MSHVIVETTVPVVVTSDDAHEPPVVVNAVETTTVLVTSAPEVIEVNAGPRGLPGPKGDKGDKGDDGDVPDAPLDGATYARQSGAWVEALPASARGAAGGVASLDASGKVPESQMPVIPDAVLSVAGKTGAVSLVPSDVTGLDTALASKADDSLTLTDAAATATLPDTAAASVASRLQVLRNNVKQAFADLGNKLNTNFASLTTRTIDGTETLAFSGGLKATVQAVLDWVLGRANTWTGPQTVNNEFRVVGGLLGYGAGSGGSVSQVTSKSTAVTLNTVNGQISMNNGALAAGASVLFALNNSHIGVGSTLIVHPRTTSVAGTNYRVEVAQVQDNGIAVIRVTNISAGSLSEALLLKFCVIAGSFS